MSTPAVEQPSEGWYQPDSSRGAHYFRRDRSLCGRYMFTNPTPRRRPFAPAQPVQSCRECTRRKRREAPPATGRAR